MNEKKVDASICRICLTFIVPSYESTSISEYAKKLDSEEVLVKEVMEKCIPEMDLEICDNAVICSSCYESLINVYIFKSKCFQTEVKIYCYMEENDLRLEDKVDLCNVVKTNKNVEEILYISDSDSGSVEILSSGGNENCSIDIEKEKTNCEKDCTTISSTFLKIPYSCARCEYRCYRKDLLEKHIHYNCKNRTNNKKYKRDARHFESCKKRNSKRHRVTHERAPHICGICNRTFTLKGQLRLHILYKHSSSDLIPYRCGVKKCQASFDRKSDFNLHIVKHVEYQPFVCQLCTKGFFDKTQWEGHMDETHGLCC